MSDLSASDLNTLVQALRNSFNFAFLVTDSQGNIIGINDDPAGKEPAGPPIMFYNMNNFRNVLDGGDFTVNPWQRNIPGLYASAGVSAAISNTVTYFADRWFAVGGASSSIVMQQVADTSIPGFSQNCTWGRSNGNANTAPIYFGQVIETLDCIRLQGQQVCFSFYAKQGANFSGAALNVQIIAGTGNNQTAAQLISGSWTTQQALPLMSPTNYSLNTPNYLSASSSLNPTTAMQRYWFTTAVPVGTTQLAVLFNYTPVGTAGANDNIAFQGLQLELGNGPSIFEHRDVQVELEICQRYAWVIGEPANGTLIADGGASAAANAQIYYMATPVQMRSNPNVSVVTGGFKVAASGALATAAIAAGSTHTVNAITITSSVTQTIGGNAYVAGGGANTGYIVASSDF